MSSTSSEKPEKPLNECSFFQPLSQTSLTALHRLLSTALVHIYVGPENTHWVLHEKLLCHHSSFFRGIFYSRNDSSSSKSFGLPDSDDAPFELFVGWLYSKALRRPETEKDVGLLLDLYLLGERFKIGKLSDDVVEAVRTFYHSNETYPGLRRVQYVYANTEEDNLMREMMVSSVARYLTLSDAIPQHWENALKKNGQLSVDIIRSIQQWHLEDRSVPDARDVSQDRGREKTGFSKIEEVDSRANIKVEDVDLDHRVDTNGATNGLL